MEGRMKRVIERGRRKLEKYRGEREARAIVARANRKSVAVVESKV
jgi:hypothetical protein